MAGMFDDLIQKYAPATGPSAPVGGTPPLPPGRTKPWTALELQVLGGSGGTPSVAAAPQGGMFDDLIAKYSTGRGSPPSVGGDIASSAGSRAVAGVLDIPGAGGDLTSLADNLGSSAAQGILSLFGVSPEKRAQAHAAANAVAGNPLPLPTSEDVKNAVGFQAYQPQTDVGKTFDTWGGGAIEMLPSLAATGGAGIVRKGVQEGLGAAAKQAGGDALKYAAAPAVAGEAAGEVTQGTPLEPWARLGAMVATGGAAGARGAKVTGALSTDEWRRVGDQAYTDMRAAGVGVKPSSFDSMVSDAEHDLHDAGYRPALHPQVATVLKEMNASTGVPQSFGEIDQLHRLAAGQTKVLDPDTRRVAGILADKIDNYMQNLKPSDLIARADPVAAANDLRTGRDAWRRMRTAESIDNMVAKAKDAAGANYTAAGLQTGIKQQFRAFKWQGKAQLTPAYKRLSPQEKKLVDAIIKGGNTLRLVGKFNFRNPVIAAMMGGLGVAGSPFLAAGALGAGELARAISARGTMAKVDQLSGAVRGGKVTAGGWGLPPNAVFYGAAAKRTSDQPK